MQDADAAEYAHWTTDNVHMGPLTVQQAIEFSRVIQRPQVQ